MKYDLIFLLNEELEQDNIKKLIESFSGKILEEEKWGKRTLSYPIKKLKSAFYFRWVFDMPKKNILELRKKLNFNEKLIRYLLLHSE